MAKLNHARVPDRDRIHLAALLSLVGSPSSPEGQEAFWAFRALLIHPDRTYRLRAALNLIPPTREEILHVVRAVHAYTAETEQAVGRQKIRVDEVVDAILQIPAPAAYIRVLHGQGFTRMGAIFHKKTLAGSRERPEFRGIFSGTVGTPDKPGYRESAEGHLRVISD